MPRTHLRGHTNILKRLLIHAGGFNLGLVMRHLIGIGTPRGLQGRVAAVLATLGVLMGVVRRRLTTISSSHRLIPAVRRGVGLGHWPTRRTPVKAAAVSGATEGPKAAKPDAVAALGDEKAIGPTRTGGSSKNANSADVTALADADLASSTPSSLAKDASPADLEALARTPGNIDESEPSAPKAAIRKEAAALGVEVLWPDGPFREF